LSTLLKATQLKPIDTMESGSANIVTHYAILIGIDDYPDKPLEGCVRDAQDTKAYLESTLHDSVEVQMIVTSQSGPQSSNTIEGRVLWPTFDNVTAAFKRVTSLAKPRNFVYIHYSGHGTQKPPSGTFSNESTGDLALVLLGGEQDKKIRCLWGFELAGLLKTMVDSGLVITLILDCCFSASVYRRKDPSVRFLPYDSKVDSEYSSKPDQIPGDERYRDVSMLPNWLVRPDRYAILAACGPHEITIELKDADGRKHGALSYFLLKTIKCVNLTKRHGDIYDHLRAKLKGAGLRQNPVLYGNQNQGFFGQVNSDIIAAAIPIIVSKNGNLQLQAGRAHGFNTDDQLIMYPLGTAEVDPRAQGSSEVAKIVCTRALTSDLERIDEDDSDDELTLADAPAIRVRTGWMARGLTRSSLQSFPIRLASGLPNLEEWLTVLRERSLEAHIDTNKHPSMFDVVLNNGEYKILDESGNIINLPSMPQDQTNIGQIGSLLEHLSRYQLIKDLVNEEPTDSFRQSFKVQILINGKSFSPGDSIEMEHNTIAELVLENQDEKYLYLFIYDLGPCWQVENVNRGTYIVVPPRIDGQRARPTRKRLRMRIPDEMREKGHSSCKDILKIFVTSQPTSFDLLGLPKLGGRAKTSQADRTPGEGGDGSENWAAMNFSIHIFVQGDTDK
jgi:hypothetical protein